jgi:putative peptide zinc metalloprotease protein
MLAIMSLLSIFIWPTYRIVKNIRQRGRLPDMKSTRVKITLAVFVGLIAAFFFLPLPVSRVHETGLVAIEPTEVTGVLLAEPARLVELKVRPGERVKKGQILGRFRSEHLAVEMVKQRAISEAERQNANELRNKEFAARSEGKEQEATQFQIQAGRAQKEAEKAEVELDRLQKLTDQVRELRAPRDGVVISAPTKDEIDKLFDRGYTETTPVFLVGDPSRLMIRVPVTPPDFRLIEEDLGRRGELSVSIYVKGRSDREFTGKVRQPLPKQDARTVPIQLTQRGGGPLAVKPGGDPNVLQPLAQVYLVDVDILDPDPAIDPGQLAVVKIHTKWRSAAWWVGRALANAMDLGFY